MAREPRGRASRTTRWRRSAARTGGPWRPARSINDFQWNQHSCSVAPGRRRLRTRDGRSGVPRFENPQLENDFLRRENSGKKTLKHHRLEVDPPVHPFEDGEVAEIVPLFEYDKPRRA